MLLRYTPACGKCALRRYDPDAMASPEVVSLGGSSGRMTCPRFPVHIPHRIFYAEELHPCFVPRKPEPPYIEPVLLRILEKEASNVIPLIHPATDE